MSVGNNIKKRRFELRMSQQDLADALGYKTRSTIAKIESGENDVTQKKLIRFAEVLDTTVEALIAGTPHFQSSYIQPNIANTVSQDSFAGDKKNKTVAVILAGGKSSRNQQNIPNQFINILNKPVIVYCMEAYQSHPSIDDIYIVCLKGWEKIVSAYAEEYHISKLRGLIPGAASGILSVKSALEYLKPLCQDDDIIIFQESTRPLITVEMISKLLQATFEHEAVTLCHTMKEYLQFDYTNGKAAYIKRDTAVCVQSPEAYKLKILKKIFEPVISSDHELTETCCAMLMYNLGLEINFVESGSSNHKIIHQEDISIVASFLRQQLFD